MLKDIKDCLNHTICKVNEETGLVEIKYKKQFTSIVLPVGIEYMIIRDKTKTVMRRTVNNKLEVHSEMLEDWFIIRRVARWPE